MIAEIAIAGDAASNDPNYAIWVLATTTLVTLVGMVLNYLKSSKVADDVKSIEVKVDGALTKFMESSERLLEVSKGAEFQKGLKEGTATEVVKQQAVEAVRTSEAKNKK